MTVVLLVGVVLLATVAVLAARRRSAVLAWERELSAAFEPGARREIGRHRVL